MIPILYVKDYTVVNPNFAKDVIAFLKLRLSPDDVEERIDAIEAAHPLTPAEQLSGALTRKQRLDSLINRIEFINHLEIMSQFAQKSNFNVLGQEVNGIHWDIAALRLYLALTCIDIFCFVEDHKKHFENAFENTSVGLKNILQSNISISSANGVTSDTKEIADYFYDIRNFYTHSGKRFHILEVPSVEQHAEFIVGPQKNKIPKTMIISENFDVVKHILSISIEIAKNEFGW